MAKAQTPIILSKYIDIGGYELEIIQGISCWCVTLNNKPIGIKTRIETAGNKYRRTMFNQKGSAKSLANRLNILFNINDFGIREIH